MFNNINLSDILIIGFFLLLFWMNTKKVDGFELEQGTVDDMNSLLADSRDRMKNIKSHVIKLETNVTELEETMSRSAPSSTDPRDEGNPCLRVKYAASESEPDNYEECCGRYTRESMPASHKVSCIKAKGIINDRDAGEDPDFPALALGSREDFQRPRTLEGREEEDRWFGIFG